VRNTDREINKYNESVKVESVCNASFNIMSLGVMLQLEFGMMLWLCALCKGNGESAQAHRHTSNRLQDAISSSPDKRRS